MDTPSELQQKKMVALAIWAALTGSMFLYAIITFFFQKGEAQPTPLQPQLLAFFLILGGIQAAASIGLRQIILSPRKLFSSLKGPIDPTNDSAVDQALLGISDRWITVHIISWALNEAMILSGFVPSFIGKNPKFMVPFLVAGVGLNLWMRPNLDGLRRQLKAWLQTEALKA